MRSIQEIIQANQDAERAGVSLVPGAIGSTRGESFSLKPSFKNVALSDERKKQLGLGDY